MASPNDLNASLVGTKGKVKATIKKSVGGVSRLFKRAPSGPPSRASTPAPVPAILTTTPIPNASVTKDSWWAEHREEIFASVRQILDVTEKALDGVPVPGAKAVVGSVAGVLKVFQTKWSNDEGLMDLKNEVDRVLKIIEPYETPNHDGLSVPDAMQTRVTNLRKYIAQLRGEWEETTSNHTVRQHLKAELIAEDIKDMTRKLATHIQHAGFEGALRTEAMVSEMYTNQASIERQQQLNALRSKLSPVTSALYDAAGSPAGCLEGTRVALLKQIYDWFSNEDTSSPSVLWLNGLAGTGKSTIASTVAREVGRREGLAASFFFSRDTNERHSLTTIVPTIAYQLALWNDGLRGSIYVAVDRNPEIASKGMTHQMSVLLTSGLEGVERLPVIGLLVLDALDECDKDGGVEGGSLLTLLIDSLPKLPFRLKILVTSRPEYSITTIFNNSILHGPSDVLALHAIDPGIVSADISLYLSSKLRDISRRRIHGAPWPEEDQLDALVKLSGSLFIFAATAVKFIDSRAFRPQRQLDLILSKTGEVSTDAQPYRTLDRLYLHILHAMVEDEAEADVICERFQRMLGAILFASEPVSVRRLSVLLSMDVMDVEYALHSLKSVLVVPDDNREHIQMFHLSFPDFLKDDTRCIDKRFLITAYVGHSTLGKGCLDILHACMTRKSAHTPGGFNLSSHPSPIQFSDAEYAREHCDLHIRLAIDSKHPNDDVDDVFTQSPDMFCIAQLTRFLLSGQEHETLSLAQDHCIRRAAAKSHLVFLQRHGPYAALVAPQSSSHVHMLRLRPCDEISMGYDDQLGVYLNVLVRLGRSSSMRTPPPVYVAVESAYDELGSRVWNNIVQPVVDILNLKLCRTPEEERPRIHWRILSNRDLWDYQLHTAESCHQATISDYAASSYIPTLSLLLTPANQLQAFRTADLRLCALSDSAQPHNTWEHKGRALGQTVVSPAQAVLALKTSTVLHANVRDSLWSEPTEFRGCRAVLAEGDLTVEDIFDLQPELPILAFAGSTPRGHISLMSCGYQAVVGSENQLSFAPAEDRDCLVREVLHLLISRSSDGWFNLDDIAYALNYAINVRRETGGLWVDYFHMGA